MEESGVTKVIAVRLERSDGKPLPKLSPSEPYDDEDVEYEAGRELVETVEPKKSAARTPAAPEAATDADETEAVEAGALEAPEGT